jgi:DNA primase
MQNTAKYLIHADLRADGVVERSDVVGAVFGQTEGLLGEGLEIHNLQESSKLGRIDVEIDSEGGQSFGQLTVSSNLDRAETAVLAAALETISRVGPCAAAVEVRRIEDTRAAKRREVVDRAKELLATAFDDQDLSSEEILGEVRESVHVADIEEFEGLPAGPHVADSDAVVVVEGRADVLALLGAGIKNAVAVEGTDVPEAVADLTRERTTTAFLDGDRGGDLIRRELMQVGEVDFVARAPEGESVEDLDPEAVTEALRSKVPAEALDPEGGAVRADTDGGAARAAKAADAPVEPAPEDSEPDESETADAEGDGTEADAMTVPEHAAALDGTGRARFLDAEGETLAEPAAGEAFGALRDAETVPGTVVLDGEIDQRLLDVAAQRGVARVVGSRLGSVTKQPAAVKLDTFDRLQE